MTNPYNFQAGNLFVGHDQLRRKLKNGLKNRSSFALLGGRRVGKTSLLLQLKKDFTEEGGLYLPRFLDMMELDEVTPNRFFEKVYDLVVQEEDSPFAWQDGEKGREYKNFCSHLKKIHFQKKEEVVVLLIDELDIAKKKLNETFFHNLRHLLMNSDFSFRFRMVASGVKELSGLIQSGSPLNNLIYHYLGILEDKAAQELIEFGFPNSLPKVIEEELLSLTGKHPYLMQGLLEKLWDKKDQLESKEVKIAAREFLREHKDFPNWKDTFSEEEKASYQKLAENSFISPPSPIVVRDDVLIVLNYHGVVDDSDPDSPRITGTMFRDWFLELMEESDSSEIIEPNTKKKPILPKKTYDVFLCHNSEDKEEVKKIGERLKQKGLKVWLDEWNLRPGISWQKDLENQIECIGSAAVFVGANGIGPWQEREIDGFLNEFVNRGCPVIPVVLPHCSGVPKLPIFLRQMTWVDFRELPTEALGKLIWGITGKQTN